jgi:hypothetical protein
MFHTKIQFRSALLENTINNVGLFLNAVSKNRWETIWNLVNGITWKRNFVAYENCTGSSILYTRCCLLKIKVINIFSQEKN